MENKFEPKLGEIIAFETVENTEENACDKCMFKDLTDCVNIACSPYDREDRKDVYFKVI